jgi:pimeloyl-ACP methyl ester carboxylesterase
MATLDERATVLETPQGPVQVACEGAGPHVLVAHGGPGGFDQGLAFYRHLRDGGCELVAPSRPGYLRTPIDCGRSPERQADLYAAILDCLGLERATIVGHSSGGPSAVHFAARHPRRTTALLLDSAIVLPFVLHLGVLERRMLESGLVARVSYELAKRWPTLMTRFAISGMSEGLTPEQRKAAVEWVTSDRSRLERMQEALASVAPHHLRQVGWANDQANEAQLRPLPFDAITAPTLIAHGTNDRNIPYEHSVHAAERITGAELITVEEGHHALPLSRRYEAVAQRQLGLAHARR